MKKLLIPIMLIILSMAFTSFAIANGKETVGMKSHVEAGVSCEDCHATNNVIDSCVTCHANSDGYYRGEKLDAEGNGIEKEYRESGKTRMANMHDSHAGKVRCTVCHTAHKPQPKLYCNHCHDFQVTIK